jgi:predicted aspartyl protease
VTAVVLHQASRWVARETIPLSVTAMGAFQVRCTIENPIDRTRSVALPKLLVDTGNELTWAPERSLARIGIAREKKDVTFVLADGEQVTRSVGFAIVRLGAHFTVDEVVFAAPGDLALLGARTLEGLNLTIDPRRRRRRGRARGRAD